METNESYLTVGKLKEQLAAIPDDTVVVIDSGKANCQPVFLPVTAFTGRELEGSKAFRLGGGRVPLAVIRSG